MAMQRREIEGTLRAVLAVAALLLAVAAPSASAAVYGTAATDEDPTEPGLNGTRGVLFGDGLQPTEEGFWSEASLTWTIGQSGSTFTYEYTFFGFEDPDDQKDPPISHVTFDLTDSAVGDGTLRDPEAVVNVGLGGSPVDSADLAFGDLDGITGAFRIERGFSGSATTVRFESNRKPVWGDLFVGNGETGLTNTLFGNRTSDDTRGYIARPNGVIPLPGAGSLGLVALGGLALSCRGRWSL